MRLFPAGAALGFALGLGAFACGDDPELQPAPTPSVPDGGGAPDGAAPPAKGRALVITPPRTTIVSNLCAELTLSMTEDGVAAPFPSSGAVTITSDASTKIFATESDCAAGPSVAPTSSVDVGAGETTKSFFLRTAAEGPVTLTASASFASCELTFEPHVFLGTGSAGSSNGPATCTRDLRARGARVPRQSHAPRRGGLQTDPRLGSSSEQGRRSRVVRHR